MFSITKQLFHYNETINSPHLYHPINLNKDTIATLQNTFILLFLYKRIIIRLSNGYKQQNNGKSKHHVIHSNRQSDRIVTSIRDRFKEMTKSLHQKTELSS